MNNINIEMFHRLNWDKYKTLQTLENEAKLQSEELATALRDLKLDISLILIPLTNLHYHVLVYKK